MKQIINKAILLLLIFSSLYFAIHAPQTSKIGLLDLTSFLLVVLAPLLILNLFSVGRFPFYLIFQTIRNLKNNNTFELVSDLKILTKKNLSVAVKEHSESKEDFLRFCSQYVSAKFSSAEVNQLLIQRSELDDLEFHRVIKDLTFLSKMSPYFGMIATVLGMIQALSSQSDFTQITSHIGVALTGTLYGVGMYSFLYVPLLQFIETLRRKSFERQTIIIEWYNNRLKEIDTVLVDTLLNQGLKDE